MPLSPDAQALLELLLTRGQTYEDIASLLDEPEDEVRAKARAALTELGGADPDRKVGLTDYLLGQADPIGRADAARHLREDAADHELASELSSALSERVPGAELPKLPPPPGGRARRRQEASPDVSPAASPGKADAPRFDFSDRRTKLTAIGLAAGVLLVAVVLGVSGVFSGDDEPVPASNSDATTTAEQTGNEDGATVPLKPVGDADADGALTVGIAGQTEPFINITARNLQPPPTGSTYIAWFMQDESSGYPYQEIPVTNSGAVNERYALPQELLAAALSSRSVDIWVSKSDEVQKLVPDAVRKGSVIDVPGERVLTADIRPIAEAAGLTGGQQGTGTAPQTTTPESSAP